MIFFRIFIITFFFIFPKTSFAKDSVNFVIANVNNHIITYSDLKDRYNFVLLTAKIKINSEDEKLILLNKIIDKMIDEELIRQEATSLKIELPDEEIDGTIESLAQKQKKNIAEFKKSFVDKKLSFEAYKNQVRADLFWSKIISESLRSRIKITDFEIKEFFEQRKLNTDVTKFLIAEIVIPDNKDAKVFAEKLAFELKRGASFKNIVKQFSQSPTVENDGEVGWVSKGDVDAKIYEAISKLERNEYCEPILLSSNYYIFKLLDKKSVMQVQDNDLSRARNIIFSRGLEIEAKRYLMDLHKNAFIEVDRKKIREF